LDTAQGIDALRRVTPPNGLVLIDSLRACAPSTDENSSEVRSVLDDLTRISEDTGATFVVVHHARKPSKDAAGGSKTSIRGSGAIFDACSSVLVFEAAKEEPIMVSHEKARISGRPAADFTLAFADVSGGLTVGASAAATQQERADTRKASATEALCAEALKFLAGLDVQRDGCPNTVTIARILKRNTQDVTQALELLELRKQIVNHGTGGARQAKAWAVNGAAGIAEWKAR
jgi:hypothetical protein